MSEPGDNGGAPEAAAFDRLEAAIGQLVERLEASGASVQEAEARATAAEARTAELAELVKRVTGDEAEAGRLMSRLKGLEQENADLRTRLERGRDGVDRMLARIRFLENKG